MHINASFLSLYKCLMCSKYKIVTCNKYKLDSDNTPMYSKVLKYSYYDSGAWNKDHSVTYITTEPLQNSLKADLSKEYGCKYLLDFLSHNVVKKISTKNFWLLFPSIPWRKVESPLFLSWYSTVMESKYPNFVCEHITSNKIPYASASTFQELEAWNLLYIKHWSHFNNQISLTTVTFS